MSGDPTWYQVLGWVEGRAYLRTAIPRATLLETEETLRPHELGVHREGIDESRWKVWMNHGASAVLGDGIMSWWDTKWGRR
jgi:hypothetical protein